MWLRARAYPPNCDGPSTGSVRGAQNGTFCRVAIFWRMSVEVRGAGQVSPKGVMGLGRGPGRFCLGGEVLLEQVGADPEAGGTWNGAADRRLLWPLRVVL